jgi:CheY-like chemotaxis protein
MIYIDKNNKNQILTFIPLIKDNYLFWHIVSINFDAKNKEEAESLIQNFLKAYEDVDGFCYLESEKKAVSIMKLGEVESYSDVKNNIEQNIDGKKCRVLAKEMSPNGLKQVQINLSSSLKKSSNDHLYRDREKRQQNVILVADDDMFIRKSLSSLLSEYAEVIEVDNGDKVVYAYLACNPDIVILDIHMPGKDGLSLISNICHEDSDAFIIMSSSDSVKDNILNARDRGAIGFLAKPPRKDKLMQYMDQCITFRRAAEEESA